MGERKYELYLCHHGIKGMKWGIRKQKNHVSRADRKRNSMSDDARTAHDLRKKKPHQMSNAELRKMNERIQLEQQYSRLNPNLVKKGMKVVATSAAVMGTVLNLYNNSDKMVALGKKVVERLVKK